MRCAKRPGDFGRPIRASSAQRSSALGCAQGLYLIVSDVEAARDEVLGRGVEVSEPSA